MYNMMFSQTEKTRQAEFYLVVTETLNEPVLAQGFSADVTRRKALVVDDNADTGENIQLSREHIL